MNTDMHESSEDQLGQTDDPFNFGLWPSLAGLIASALIIWFMFHFANGNY
nr:hypothetical protein [uncultured Cohaesibacter sp.]